MRFKEKDMPYTTEQLRWRNAIKEKRKYAKQYTKNKTEDITGDWRPNKALVLKLTNFLIPSSYYYYYENNGGMQ